MRQETKDIVVFCESAGIRHRVDFFRDKLNYSNDGYGVWVYLTDRDGDTVWSWIRTLEGLWHMLREHKIPLKGETNE